MITRPFRWPEAIWAVAGAVLLVALGLLPVGDALAGMRKGIDVYLFLTGMMLIAELARREGLFDWLAALAVEHAQGSPQRLFLLVYGVGTLVTVLLSNDATAIVLTPAVYAATRAAGATPLPYLFVCAFIANAASFVLPISNPANLVVYGARMPHLRRMAAAIRAALDRLDRRRPMSCCAWRCAARSTRSISNARCRGRALSHGGKLTAWGIAAIGVVLLGGFGARRAAGTADIPCGVDHRGAVLALARQSPLPLLKGIAWGVLPLVAGLFVMVEALVRTGVIAQLSALLHRGGRAIGGEGDVAGRHRHRDRRQCRQQSAGRACRRLGRRAAITCRSRSPRAILIGVDLGPNLSVTGSLATILWLVALRREAIDVSAWRFLKLGWLVMFPALILALAALLI